MGESGSNKCALVLKTFAFASPSYRCVHRPQLGRRRRRHVARGDAGAQGHGARGARGGSGARGGCGALIVACSAIIVACGALCTLVGSWSIVGRGALVRPVRRRHEAQGGRRAGASRSAQRLPACAPLFPLAFRILTPARRPCLLLFFFRRTRTPRRRPPRPRARPRRQRARPRRRRARRRRRRRRKRRGRRRAARAQARPRARSSTPTRT